MTDGAEVIDLTVQLITARSGTTFGRGFRLRAIGRKLYVQMSGRKVPLYLGFDAEPAAVQSRALELGAFVQAHGPAFCSQAWAEACAVKRARTGKTGKARLRLEGVIDKLRRIKLAEGASEATFNKHYLAHLRRLDPEEPLGEESLLRAIEQTEPFSITRRRLIALLRRTCALCGAPWDERIMESLGRSGSPRQRRQQPFFSDEVIMQLLAPGGGLEPSWRRVMVMMAVYGLRPWEAWVVEPCRVRQHCVWVPIGKKSTRGVNPSRQVPPFHPEWVEQLRVHDLWNVPLPEITRLGRAGAFTNRRLQSTRMMGPGGTTSYGFRHAYARRLHSPRYRVTDAHAALFMGHTVKTHCATYRDWLGQDDPISIYLGPSTGSLG